MRGATAAEHLDSIWVRPKAPWQRLAHAQIREHLENWQSEGGLGGGVICVGCGRVLERAFMQLDHVQPRSEGGSNFIDNRILLCGPCNRTKGDTLTLRGLVRANARSGWMQDNVRATGAQEAVRNQSAALRERLSGLR